MDPRGLPRRRRLAAACDDLARDKHTTPIRLCVSGTTEHVMTADQPLLLERRNAVAIISINDPPSNRMTLEFMDRLEQVIEGLAFDDSLRSLVCTARASTASRSEWI